MNARRKGRPLRPGALIAVPTPASPLLELEYLASGVAWLEEQGFQVRLTANANVGRSFAAGPAELRAQDLLGAFADPDVDAICPLAGGHAASGILRWLDYDLIADNPKPFVAFSDLTAVHAALLEVAGIVTFYGPMVSGLATLAGWAQLSWVRALTTTEPLGVVDSDGPRARTLVAGVADGDLVGGTLSLLATVLGTPFEIDTRGRILLLEDVNEEPPRIERFLTHLLNAGKLQECAGICLGNFLSCEPREHRPRWDGYNPTVEELIEELIVPLGVPTIAGVRLGHGPEVATVPLGVHARLDADSGRLEILEGAFAE